MYILVLDNVPDEFVPVITAHASLACYLRNSDNPHMIDWLENSFKKCIVKVNQKEFNKAKEFEGCTVMTESALDGQEVAIALTPRPHEDWPKPVRFYKLWKF